MIEPAYRDTFWCRQTLKGIAEETARKKYEYMVLDQPIPADLDWTQMYGDARKLLIVVGTSLSWIPGILQQLKAQEIHVILVSLQPASAYHGISTILMDHAETLRTLYQYLYSLGKNQIALYGINPNSSADRLKTECFREILQELEQSDAQDRIYYNNASLADCFNRFQASRQICQAAICANDVVAFSLIRHLGALGLKVPDDLYVVSFGDTLLARLFHPSLTTAALNHAELGRQAVAAWSYLSKNPSIVSLAIKVECRIHIRESTNQDVPQTARPLAGRYAYAPPIVFYDDPEVRDALAVENLVSQCDELNLQILEGLYEGEKYSILADRLFTSENALKYRIKRMLTLLGKENKDDLVGLLAEYLDRQSLADARQIKAGTNS